MPNPRKEETVAGLREIIAGSKGAILTDYRGLTVAEVTNLRKKLRDAKAEYHIVKNTLFKLASEGVLPVADLESHLAGPTAIGFAKGDPVGAAKVLIDYAKDHKAISVKAGVLSGKVYDPKQVEALSKTPPREVLIAQMMGSLNSPITGLVGTLNGILSNFVFTLQAVADQKGAA